MEESKGRERKYKSFEEGEAVRGRLKQEEGRSNCPAIFIRTCVHKAHTRREVMGWSASQLEWVISQACLRLVVRNSDLELGRNHSPSRFANQSSLHCTAEPSAMCDCVVAPPYMCCIYCGALEVEDSRGRIPINKSTCWC